MTNKDNTHRQCKKCLAWVPKSWEEGSHTCPPWLVGAIKKYNKENKGVAQIVETKQNG